MARSGVVAALALAATACFGAPLQHASESPGIPTPEPVPSGEIAVAYPDQPGTWLPVLTIETSAVDLAALWGLPLYFIDHYGQLRPGLAEDATSQLLEHGAFEVRVALRTGKWSDGIDVTSRDVVATVDAMAVAGLMPRLYESVRVDGDHGVILRFTSAYGRWPYLLAGDGVVLPAHVLEDGGLDAFAGGVPVSGGRFALTEFEPGLKAVFTAHPAGPLGAPRLERIVVLFTPSFETALGLLDDERVDGVLGYLPVNPVERAQSLEGVTAAAPLGGTWVLVRFRGDGPMGGEARADRRGAVRTVFDATELVDGLLQEEGSLARSTIPRTVGPFQDGQPRQSLSGVGDIELLTVTWREVAALTVRALQGAADGAGGSMTIARMEPDVLASSVDSTGDAALLVRRDGPRPSLEMRAPTGASAELLDALVAADAAGRTDGVAGLLAQDSLYFDAHELPLFNIGVAHAFGDHVTGWRASSWPGLAFWDVGAWQVVSGNAS